MHELSMITALCRQVEKIAMEHHATKVIRVVLETGDVEHMIAPDHLKDLFLIFRTSSPLFQETSIEFRKSEQLCGSEILLRDIELERN